MDETTVTTDLRRYLADELLIPEAAIDARSDLADAGLDSIGLVELIAYIESRFRVALSPEDCISENFRTLPGIAATVTAAARG
tara:strand:- start:190 stop:438 length:249 start_codon:yes stop_codon:yes gene_type:complete